MAMFDDYDIITLEDLEDIKESISTQDLPTAVNTIREVLEKQDLVELNIGVTGESGSGKSTFVNAFRGLGDEEEDSAITGPVETTKEPKAYFHPKYKNVKVWDLPGIGTPNFKADEYLKVVEFERYDFFIIIASDRFRECHILLAKEIVRMGKRFYFVRSKIDQSIDAEKKSKKKSFDQKKTLDSIREDCEKGPHSGLGAGVSCWGRASSLPAAHDMEGRLPSVRERRSRRHSPGGRSLLPSAGTGRSRERGTPASWPKPEEPSPVCRAIRQGPSSATARPRRGDDPILFFFLSPLSSLLLLLPSPFLSPCLSYPQVPAGARERSPPEDGGVGVGSRAQSQGYPPGLRGVMEVCGEWGGAERRGNKE